MKRQGLLLALPLAALAALAAVAQDAPVDPAAAQAPALETDQQRISYALGQDIGQSFKQQEIDVDLDVFMRGFGDAVSGAESAMTMEQMKAAIQVLQKQMQAKSQERQAAQQQEAVALAARNQAEGEAFLVENAKRDTVKVTTSGLQYEVLTPGEGPSPSATDRVTVHYKGTLIDGSEFDSSYSRGEPTSFSVGGVIAGWTEALQLMNVGAKYKLFIPGDLAYGMNPRPGGPIGPNATLVFEVELLKIN